MPATAPASNHFRSAPIYGRAIGQVQYGSSVPELQTMSDPLVKIVPTGETVSPYSPFFTRASDLNDAVASGTNLSDHFGLPIKSEAAQHDVYQIAPRAASADVFVSKVAPTSELGGLVQKSGGAAQYLVGNRGAWSDPVLVGSVANQ